MGFIHASNMNIRVFANKLLKKNHLYADTENKLKHETISFKLQPSNNPCISFFKSSCHGTSFTTRQRLTGTIYLSYNAGYKIGHQQRERICKYFLDSILFKNLLSSINDKIAWF